jgi:hypothetical protein
VIDLTVTKEVALGGWLAPRLLGEFGAVTLAIPAGYPAYARIFHPASDSHGHSVSWFEVAKATGRMVHPLMQWHALVGSSDPFSFTGSLWSGGNPARGDLAPHAVDALCVRLAQYTADAKHCVFAVWAGWSWVHGTRATFSVDELTGPYLRLDDREYLLLAGPLSAVSQLCYPNITGNLVRKSPNLFWPADHAWCVASEIDYDSTLLGGPSDLVEIVLETPGLEAYRVDANDSLAADADRINNFCLK